MIVGTAGHIDHGKTALVLALTGVDADRLPEEKARGVTLELGFAYADVGGFARMGFVDVPGHERLVRTMLAGATGIDCLMLVVAADDGVMPQTREHVAIADLLGIRDAIVVLTKCDRVDAERLREVELEVADLLAGTSLEGAEAFCTSVLTGEGVGAVASKLASIGARGDAGTAKGRFRLAVDRVFSLTGVGLVVTGAAHSGEVRVGDRLVLSPGGVQARVRGLRVHDAEAVVGRAGERCALNITGPRLEKDAVRRGMWVTEPEADIATERLDVRLRVSSGEAKALKHWTPVHVHLGSVDVLGRVSVLEGGAIDAGTSRFARLLLDEPVGAVARDRFVIRDQSATRTIGGGRVVDPSPPERHARKPARLAALAAMDHDDHRAALDALAAVSSDGMDLSRFVLMRNLNARDAADLLAENALVRVATPKTELCFTAERWAAVRGRVTAALEAYQETRPDSPGATVAEVLKASAAIAARPAAGAALDLLVAEGVVVRFGALVHLRGHEIRLSLEEENLWTEIRDALAAAGSDQPRVAALAEQVQTPEDELRSTLTRMARLGRLKWVSKNYFVLPDILAGLAAEAESLARDHPDGLLTVGRFRERTRIQRHFTMPLLEFFDRVGFTSRVPDGRRILRTHESMFRGTA